MVIKTIFYTLGSWRMSISTEIRELNEDWRNDAQNSPESLLSEIPEISCERKEKT